jgi:hypothetical protein
VPTPTYTALATVTLGTAAASVTFSSIPATYRDLILISFAKSVSSDSNIRARFNSDTGSNYSYVRMIGTGSAASSDSTTTTGLQVGRQTNTGESGFGMGIAHIMDYSATDKHKTVLVRSDNASAATVGLAGRWANTAAITSIVLASFETATNFAAGSTFSLYAVIS